MRLRNFEMALGEFEGLRYHEDDLSIAAAGVDGNNEEKIFATQIDDKTLYTFQTITFFNYAFPADMNWVTTGTGWSTSDISVRSGPLSLHETNNIVSTASTLIIRKAVGTV